jgi:hypothetical protein
VQARAPKVEARGKAGAVGQASKQQITRTRNVPGRGPLVEETRRRLEDSTLLQQKRMAT